jgi:hypothetical protein
MALSAKKNIMLWVYVFIASAACSLPAKIDASIGWIMTWAQPTCMGPLAKSSKKK